MFEKLLVPVDGSKHARHAVEMAAGLANCHGSAVYLLHVIRDLSLPKEILDMVRSGEVTESRMEILENSAEIILDNAREQLEQAGVAGVKSEFVMGDPASQILNYAGKHGVDLIVIGHRGLGPHKGFLGGVAGKLVNMTTIPCLIAAWAA